MPQVTWEETGQQNYSAGLPALGKWRHSPPNPCNGKLAARLRSQTLLEMTCTQEVKAERALESQKFHALWAYV